MRQLLRRRQVCFLVCIGVCDQNRAEKTCRETTGKVGVAPAEWTGRRGGGEIESPGRRQGAIEMGARDKMTNSRVCSQAKTRVQPPPS
ncbi:unnamed protein product [Protopolystoma xenopodis]|uniref:Uncharacterized protein n=1 Tax=Protopolystoma xenopodis TaxID=117903 RepID=A0A3S4ZPG4_9PLAT|nr:unnamed protein product [Protopolystoma xenopodis]